MTLERPILWPPPLMDPSLIASSRPHSAPRRAPRSPHRGPFATLVAASAAPVKALVATTNGAHLALIVAAPLVGPVAPLPAAPSCTFVPLYRGPERLQQRSLWGEAAGVASGSLQPFIVSPLALSRGAARRPVTTEAHAAPARASAAAAAGGGDVGGGGG
ncbi:unnamed protein product [Closterium sp. Naga37s-1]|nr:unnamed protein product [Closterium sp. Naga37s-1]